MLEKREGQKDHYVRMHKDYLYQYVDSIIGGLLPVGTETKIRGSYHYAFRIASVSVFLMFVNVFFNRFFNRQSELEF